MRAYSSTCCPDYSINDLAGSSACPDVICFQTLTLAFDTVIVYVCIGLHDNIIFAFPFTALTLYSAIMYFIICIYNYYYARVSPRSPSSTFCIRRVHSLYKSFDIILLNFCVSNFLYVVYSFLLRRRVSVGSVASMLR